MSCWGPYWTQNESRDKHSKAAFKIRPKEWPESLLLPFCHLKLHLIYFLCIPGKSSSAWSCVDAVLLNCLHRLERNIVTRMPLVMCSLESDKDTGEIGKRYWPLSLFQILFTYRLDLQSFYYQDTGVNGVCFCCIQKAKPSQELPFLILYKYLLCHRTNFFLGRTLKVSP